MKIPVMRYLLILIIILTYLCMLTCSLREQDHGWNWDRPRSTRSTTTRSPRRTTRTTRTTTTAVPVAKNVTDNSTASNSTGRPYHGEVFDAIYQTYTPIHGFLSLFVCIFGVFANIMNVIVLSRKEMWSPTNAILTGIAVANLVVNIDYIPFTIHTSIVNEAVYSARSSHAWAIFLLIHALISVTFHSISSWLIVLLAVWRYISVSFPTESKSYCTMRYAKLIIALTYFLTPILSLPLYLAFSVQMVTFEVDGKNITTHSVSFSELSMQNNELLQDINFWTYSVVMKLIPCILLTYISIALIRVVIRADKRRQLLTGNNGARNASINAFNISNNSLSTDVTSGGPGNNTGTAIPMMSLRTAEERKGSDFLLKQDTNMLSLPSNRSTQSTSSLSLARIAVTQARVKKITSQSSQSNRTNKMLLAILLFFLVSELPLGITYLLVGILGAEFNDSVYAPLGDLFDVLALINASINFILLATMSRLFRETFCKIFWNKYQDRIRSLKQSMSSGSTGNSKKDSKQKDKQMDLPSPPPPVIVRPDTPEPGVVFRENKIYSDPTA